MSLACDISCMFHGFHSTLMSPYKKNYPQNDIGKKLIRQNSSGQCCMNLFICDFLRNFEAPIRLKWVDNFIRNFHSTWFKYGNNYKFIPCENVLDSSERSTFTWFERNYSSMQFGLQHEIEYGETHLKKSNVTSLEIFFRKDLQ